MATDVFISYSRQNLAVAETLFDHLQERGVSSWVDWQNIPRSSGWWDEIKRGIDAASTFVFLLSNDSLTSPICTLELAHALERGKRLIPVIIEQPDFDAAVPVRPDDALFQKILAGRDLFSITREVRMTLRERNWVFFNTGPQGQVIPFESAVDDLLKTIRSDLPHARRHALLLIRINEWEAGDRADDLLLIGQEVTAAEAWLSAADEGNKEPHPTELHRAFITRSRAAEDRRRRVLRRFQVGSVVFSAVAVMGVVVAIGAALAADDATQDANRQQTNVAIAGATLSPVPGILAAAEDEVSTQAAAAADAAAQAEIAFGQLTPIPPTLTAAAQAVITQQQIADAAATTAADADALALAAEERERIAGTEAAVLIIAAEAREDIANTFSEASEAVVSDRFTQAIRLMNDAVNRYPDNARVYFLRALINERIGEPDAAIADYTDAIRLDPQNDAAYSNRALVYAGIGEFDLAVADHDQAIELDPDNPLNYLGRGFTYRDAGELDAALADFDTVIGLDPENVTAYQRRGVIYAEREQYDTALADLDTAVSLDPLSADLLVQRGTIHGLAGDTQPALADFDEAIRLDPENAGAYGGRGGLYLDLALDQAEDDIDTALLIEAFNQAYRDLRQAERLGFALSAGEQAALTFIEENFAEFLVAEDETIEAGPLSLGTQSGEIPVGGAAVWTFEADGGEILTLFALPDSFGIDPFLRVRDPSGTVIALDDDSGGAVSAFLGHVLLPERGTYRVEVGSFQNLTSGSYQLTATAGLPLKNLKSGENSGRIAPGEAEAWQLEVSPGQLVTLQVTVPIGSSFDGVMVLRDPDGEVLAFNDDGDVIVNPLSPVIRDVEIVSAGTHIVEVGSFNGRSGGEYTLTLTVISDNG